jgi:hypothetical protein
MSDRVNWTVILGWALSTVVPSVNAHSIVATQSISAKALVMSRIQSLHIVPSLQTSSPIALVGKLRLILCFQNPEKIVQHQFLTARRNARKSCRVDTFASRYAIMANVGHVWNGLRLVVAVDEQHQIQCVTKAQKNHRHVPESADQLSIVAATNVESVVARVRRKPANDKLRSVNIER